MRNVTPQGRELITQREGMKLRMYLDTAGKPTIGVGHLLTPAENASGAITIDGEQVLWRDGLTPSQVAWLLDKDLDVAERAVERLAPGLPDNQFDALVSVVFNIGVSAFEHPYKDQPDRPSGILRQIRAGRPDLVPAEFMKWVHSGGKVDKGLINRRKSEGAQWAG